MDRVIREIRDSERMEGVDRIWLPGEMEFYKIRERLEKGIPVNPALVEQLRQLARNSSWPIGWSSDPLQKRSEGAWVLKGVCWSG